MSLYTYYSILVVMVTCQQLLLFCVYLSSLLAFNCFLHFRVTGRCRHYMIDQTSSGKYIIVGEPKVHKSLEALVEYYRKVNVTCTFSVSGYFGQMD